MDLGSVDVIDAAVRSWKPEQPAKVEQHRPGMEDQGVKEMLALQSALRRSVAGTAFKCKSVSSR